MKIIEEKTTVVVTEKTVVFDGYNLKRFVSAQDGANTYYRALGELKRGHKDTHWIWFIFPQLKGLGHSAMSMEYGIASLDEARAYLANPLLAERLRECVLTVLTHAGSLRLTDILGDLDAKKFRSCMTLFDLVCPEDIFEVAIAKLCDGNRCERTLRMVR